MRALVRVMIGLALLLTAAAPGFAEVLPAAQQQALTERIDSFDTAVRANDIDGIMGVVPPKVLDRLASQFGLSVDQLIGEMQKQINEVMTDVKIESFGMDAKKVDFVTESGLTYGLIPTESVIDLGPAGKLRSTTTTVALLEDDNWYLVRIDNSEQIDVIKQVYPMLADVQFPAGTLEPVTQ